MAGHIITLIDTLEDWFLRIVFVLIMLIGAYALYDSYCVYQAAQGRSMMAYRPVQEAGDVSPDRSFFSGDMAAWLTVFDTKIDFPVMQGDTNYEYLNKAPTGEYSVAGSIYLDSRNDMDFTDPYSLVYGHHMDGEAMFGTLDLFEDEEYFDAHRKGELITRAGTYEIEFFAFMRALASDDEVFDVDTDADRMAFIIEHSQIFREPGHEGNIIAMSTCSDSSTIARTLVFGILKEKAND